MEKWWNSPGAPTKNHLPGASPLMLAASSGDLASVAALVEVPSLAVLVDETWIFRMWKKNMLVLWCLYRCFFRLEIDETGGVVFSMLTRPLFFWGRVQLFTCQGMGFRSNTWRLDGGNSNIFWFSPRKLVGNMDWFPIWRAYDFCSKGLQPATAWGS